MNATLVPAPSGPMLKTLRRLDGVIDDEPHRGDQLGHVKVRLCLRAVAKHAQAATILGETAKEVKDARRASRGGPRRWGT